MTEKIFVFNIGPNDLDDNAANYIQLQAIISAYFPPEENSDVPIIDKSHWQNFYSGRRFWIGAGEEIFARAHAGYGMPNTWYEIKLRFTVEETTSLPHEENKTIGDFISEITSLPSYSFTHDVS